MRSSDSPEQASGEMIRPPVNYAMRMLDRAFFRKDLALTAARVTDKKLLGSVLRSLEKSKDVLRLERFPSIVSDPDTAAHEDGKCVLLRSDIRVEGTYHLPCSH